MARGFVGATALIVVLFVGGWALVELSGQGGDRPGGSSLVWSVGGVMFYASIVCAPVCVLAGIVALLVERVVHGPETRRSSADYAMRR